MLAALTCPSQRTIGSIVLDGATLQLKFLVERRDDASDALDRKSYGAKARAPRRLALPPRHGGRMPHLLDPKPLSNDEDYCPAIDELEALMTADPDTPGGRRFDELATLIEDYEGARPRVDHR